MRFRERNDSGTLTGSIIFTYQNERRLFALIGIIIVAALLALVQIGAQRSGSVSPITMVAGSLFALGQYAVSATVGGTRALASAIVALPQLERENVALKSRNQRLTEENARLHELASSYAAEAAVRPVVDLYHGIEARVIGFPPRTNRAR